MVGVLPIEKIACYIRVSTQEQKLHGISLDAQRDKLKEYAKKHNLKIVEWYEDEGVSGRKLIKNRPALQRMLHDAHAKKFDRIIFIKLDRFFRSVAEYHECMKYIDPVIWTATEEKYDLSTANGRAFVNMKLTIAELEADQTGERIKLVNEYKAKTGQALAGSHCQGIAYTVKKVDGMKKVVKDPETQEMVKDFIDHFLMYQNKRQAHIYILNKYDTKSNYQAFSNMLTDTKIYGHYRGNDDYCEPYVDKATFDKIQTILGKNVKSAPTNNVYLFSGLIRCIDCGRNLTARYSLGGGQRQITYFSYRCNKAYKDDMCSFKRSVSEHKLEAELLDKFDEFINDYITTVNVSDNRADSDNELINKRISELKSEMKNTTIAFRKNRMTEKEYDKEYDKLEAQLKELEAQLEPLMERDLTIYEELLKSDWKDLYSALNRDNKRAFWRKYIKEIEVNSDTTLKSVIFF